MLYFAAESAAVAATAAAAAAAAAASKVWRSCQEVERGLRMRAGLLLAATLIIAGQSVGMVEVASYTRMYTVSSDEAYKMKWNIYISEHAVMYST